LKCLIDAQAGKNRFKVQIGFSGNPRESELTCNVLATDGEQVES